MHPTRTALSSSFPSYSWPTRQTKKARLTHSTSHPCATVPSASSHAHFSVNANANGDIHAGRLPAPRPFTARVTSGQIEWVLQWRSSHALDCFSSRPPACSQWFFAQLRHRTFSECVRPQKQRCFRGHQVTATGKTVSVRTLWSVSGALRCQCHRCEQNELKSVPMPMSVSYGAAAVAAGIHRNVMGAPPGGTLSRPHPSLAAARSRPLCEPATLNQTPSESAVHAGW